MGGIIYLIFLIFNGLFIFFAYFGYFVRPAFLSGESTTTMYLLRTYDSIGPWGPVVVLGMMVVLWIITTPAKVLGLGFTRITESALRLLPFTLLMSGIASLPTLANNYDYVDQVDFGNSSYNLVMRSGLFDTIQYGVIECDSIQTNCRQIYFTNELPAALGQSRGVPVAQPTQVVTVNGQNILVAPNNVTAAAEKPAELLVDTTESALGLRIANQYQTITIAEPEEGLETEIFPSSEE
ncbi:MAG: hypothetical protein AAF633_13775 [Chloroflexota bacterium]